MGTEFSKVAISKMMDIWRGDRESLSQLYSKGDICFEESGGTVGTFRYIRELMGKDGVLDMWCLIDDYPMQGMVEAYI